MRKPWVLLSSLMLSLMVLFAGSSAFADLCFICRGGKACQYCRSRSGKDTQADRKHCKEIGCDVGGTASCPTAANVKVCVVAPAAPGFRAAQSSAFFAW